ncbi:MAG: chorismate mutase [Phototrophicaceae bacterium]
MTLMVRGVRGATTVAADEPDLIIQAARELLAAMIAANNIKEEHVASVMFTTTPDLTAAYPAEAARLLGWQQTALMGCQEMAVPDGLARCIRVLIHWNTIRSLDEIVHVYTNGAESLRPDILNHNPSTAVNEDEA